MARATVATRMNAQTFIRICESLYGDDWQPKLARKLARDVRTIRRWKTGENDVPKVVEEWLKEQQRTRGTPMV